MSHGPGLTKVRSVPLLRSRTVRLFATVPGLMARTIDVADTMSEGSVRVENGESVYYGSTVLLLGLDAVATRTSPGLVSAADSAAVTALLARDPHLRLLAIRIAHREAMSRAHASLATVHADLRVSFTPTMVRIDVDVSARVLDKHARKHA
jgi:hypothetical protein